VRGPSPKNGVRCVIILARGAGPLKAMTTDFLARSTLREGGREEGREGGREEGESQEREKHGEKLDQNKGWRDINTNRKSTERKKGEKGRSECKERGREGNGGGGREGGRGTYPQCPAEFLEKAADGVVLVLGLTSGHVGELEEGGREGGREEGRGK